MPTSSLYRHLWLAPKGCGGTRSRGPVLDCEIFLYFNNQGEGASVLFGAQRRYGICFLGPDGRRTRRWTTIAWWDGNAIPSPVQSGTIATSPRKVRYLVAWLPARPPEFVGVARARSGTDAVFAGYPAQAVLRCFIDLPDRRRRPPQGHQESVVGCGFASGNADAVARSGVVLSEEYTHNIDRRRGHRREMDQLTQGAARPGGYRTGRRRGLEWSNVYQAFGRRRIVRVALSARSPALDRGLAPVLPRCRNLRTPW